METVCEKIWISFIKPRPLCHSSKKMWARNLFYAPENQLEWLDLILHCLMFDNIKWMLFRWPVLFFGLRVTDARTIIVCCRSFGCLFSLVQNWMGLPLCGETFLSTKRGERFLRNTLFRPNPIPGRVNAASSAKKSIKKILRVWGDRCMPKSQFLIFLGDLLEHNHLSSLPACYWLYVFTPLFLLTLRKTPSWSRGG